MVKTLSGQSAIVHEIFSGIQGEGELVGYRQIFIRFHGCPLACRYCDTSASYGSPPTLCRVEEQAGTRVMQEVANPLTPALLLSAIQQLELNYRHHSVSFTGGEPLLHQAFLDKVLPLLHQQGIASFLETNGILTSALTELTCFPRYIAMDIKLPSVAGIKPCWEEHRAFLKLAVSRLAELSYQRLQVKVVFAARSLAEVEQAAQLVAAVDSAICFVLQPVTPHAADLFTPDPQEVLTAQQLCSKYLTDVRVIPQTHVVLRQW